MDGREGLRFRIPRVALANAIFDDAIAYLAFHICFDHVVGQRLGNASHLAIGKIPNVVLDVERAAVVTMRPAVETAIEPALQEVACRQAFEL